MSTIGLLRESKSNKSQGSLHSFQAYREQEAANLAAACAAVSLNGELLEYETLELRVHPPNIEIDNESDSGSTHITLDSANRPGTLVEVVQHFTELNLNVKSARISSDGGWFVDVFEVQEACGRKVTDPGKLDSIKKMLNINFGRDAELIANGDETDDMQRVETTVFELAGADKSGLLADVTQLLTTNGCNVRSAAVWTYKNRVTFVLSVTHKGAPVSDGIKLQRLRQLLFDMMSDGDRKGTVNIKKVRGEVHHDRRLHQLMLLEEMAQYETAGPGNGPSSPKSCGSRRSSPSCLSDSVGSVHADLRAAAAAQDSDNAVAEFRSPKFCTPDICISYCSQTNYWLVDIKCRDRAKLLFDTVCTLADMDYDVYHATIDAEGGAAHQEFYVKPRLGDTGLDHAKADKLKAMLTSSIQRRFPKGLKVHVHSVDRFGCLASLTRVLKAAGLTITRAKVKTYAVNSSSGHTFYVMDTSGKAPDRERVEQACSDIGGKLVEAGEEALCISGSDHKFSFSFLNRQWHKGWGGSPSSSLGSG